MTPAELRRLADRKVAEAGSLTTAAERLRPEAAALRGALEPLLAMSTRVWVGPAARAFEEDTRSRGRVLDQQADRLNRIANELAGRAGRLRAEATGIRAQAAAAEAAAAAAGLSIPSGVN
jgi:hypothetical protein